MGTAIVIGIVCSVLLTGTIVIGVRAKMAKTEKTVSVKGKKEGELLKLSAPVGKLPAGYEWYGNAVGVAQGKLGPVVRSVTTYDGFVIDAGSAALFPSKMFHDRDEPGRIWDSGWLLHGEPSGPPIGHLICGVPGTPFEGYVFVWAAGGGHGGRWARPKMKTEIA